MPKNKLPARIANQGLVTRPDIALERWLLDKQIVDLVNAMRDTSKNHHGAVSYTIINPETGSPYPEENEGLE